MKVLKQLWCYLTKGHQYCFVRIAGTKKYRKHCSECGYELQETFYEDGTKVKRYYVLTGGPR